MNSVIEIVKAYGLSTVKHGEGQMSSPCPFCGGNDRFVIWLNNDGGRY